MTNPWLARRVMAYAHQGGSYEGPSSTLHAIRLALDCGASAIELDVHATKDRQIVVCHDETVERTTNHRGAIASFTLDELRAMDNAYWWIEGATVTHGRDDGEYLLRSRAPLDRSLAIATLEEVATSFPGVIFNLDIKQTAPDVESYEMLLAQELRRLEMTSSVMVASFHDDAITAFRVCCPEVATSAATNEVTAFYFSMFDDGPLVVPPVAAFQVPSRVGDIEVVTERFVEAAHGAGVAVHVWTINEPDEMGHLVDLGVDAIISDRPSVLVGLLRQRACLWEPEG
ncbi:MAG: glycerophosphodiester phosphodiesterase [Acidimicrobiales bacterium]